MGTKTLLNLLNSPPKHRAMFFSVLKMSYRITLQVTDEKGERRQWWMPANWNLMMKLESYRQYRNTDQIDFYFKGQLITGNETPESIGWVDGDTLIAKNRPADTA